MVEGWQGSEYRTRAAFGNAFWLCGAGFNSARASLHVLFYWKGDLVPRFRREQNCWHHEAETPRYQRRLAAVAPIPCGQASGTPNQRLFRSNLRVSVPTACFHGFLFISKGEYVFLFRREQYLQTTGFRPAVADAACCCCGGHAPPEGARMGRRICEFRFVFVSVPVARSDHCSYRCGYTTFVLPSWQYYRILGTGCTRCFRRRPFRQPRQHRDAGGVGLRTRSPGMPR